MPPRTRNVDVFGGILEASDGELEAAGVIRNEDIEDVRSGPSSRNRPSKSRVPSVNGTNHSETATQRTQLPRAHNTNVFEVPKEGTYLIEDRTPLMHEPDEPEGSDSLELPLRSLECFCLFEPGTRILVPITTLWEGTGACEAFGSVLPHIKYPMEDYDYEKDKIPFKTTVILRYLPNILAEKIMIQTEYAIYTLENPSSFYEDYYISFYKKEMFLRKVVQRIFDDPDSTEEDFFDSLDSEDNKDPVLKKVWTRADVVPEMKYTEEELKQVLAVSTDVSWEDVQGAPLLELLLADRHSTLPQPRQRPLPRPQSPQVIKKRKKTKGPMCWETTVTPIVHSFIHRHIDTAIKVVGDWPAHLKKKALTRERPPNPPLLRNYIPAAGDFVLIKGIIDSGSESESESEPESESKTQHLIAQVIRVYSKKKFHARFFVHGSETLLEEFAHGQELFLSVADGCENLTADMVVGKYEVDRISLRELSQQEWPDKDTYFYCAAWDRNHPAGLIEVTDKQVAINQCHKCLEDGEPLSKLTNNGARVRNVEYHRHDFIRYKVKDKIVCSLGQINRIVRSHNTGEIQFEVFQIGRSRDRFGSEHANDLELFFTSSTKFIHPADILGHVQILSEDDYDSQCKSDSKWLYKQFNFYMKSKASNLDARLSPLEQGDFQTCAICSQKESTKDFSFSVCRGERVLKALDPYIGAAGFGIGLSEGCSMKTVFGVDKNPSAAETARRNLTPDATILTNDACRILNKIVKGSLDPGVINLIYSGPPCQNDSGLNRHKTDPRRPLFTTLSYVEHFRPEFFVLESVIGFLSRKIIRKMKEGKDIEEKKAGELKLTLKILHFLGYNVSGDIMYALSYGVPQTRSRFFLVASLPCYGTFKFPEPTHGFRTAKGQKDPVGRLLPRPVKQRKYNDTLSASINLGLGTGLLETVTVAETLSDLPYFDWKIANSERPIRLDMKQVVVGPRKDIWGICDNRFSYETPPTNSYQRRLRFDIGYQLYTAYQHYTRHFVSDKVENILDLPIVDGADYRHLEQENLEWGLRDPASSKAIQGHRGHAYTRLVSSGYFDTVVTQVGPNAKQNKIIHPHCKRILTVREFARAQGFPDSFIFYSEDDKVDDYLKQIGNSVPFGVSAAIGRAIQELVFKKWLKDNDRDEE